MNDLIIDIETYAAAADMTVSTVCTYAINDGQFVSRLMRPKKNGKPRECMPSTEAQVRDFMKNNPPKNLRRRAGRSELQS